MRPDVVPAAGAGLALAAALLLAALAARPRPASAAYAGPYIVYMDQFFPCEDEGPTPAASFFSTITPYDPKKPSELQRITGNFTISSENDLDDSYWVRVKLDQKKGKEWKESVLNIGAPAGACSGLRENVPDAWRVIFGQTMSQGPCVAKGKSTHVFKDEPINWTFPKIPVLPYGHWRGLFRLGKGKKTMLCKKAEGHSITRATQRG